MIEKNKHYYQRVRIFLREYEYPKANIPLDFQRIMAFFRSNIRLGVFGQERFQYWKIVHGRFHGALTSFCLRLPWPITVITSGRSASFISNGHKQAALQAADLVRLVSSFVSTFLERTY